MSEVNETGEKKRRGRRGEGSIYWDKEKNCYRGEISLGILPNGQRNRPKVYAKTMTEVREKFKELRKQHERGVRLPLKYTLEEAVREFLMWGLKGRDQATIDKLTTLAETHVIPSLGKGRLNGPDSLRAQHLDEWLEAKSHHLATRTLGDLLSIVDRSINFAIKRDKALRNVADHVEVPQGTAGRPSRSLTLPQAHRVIEASEQQQRGLWIEAYIKLSLLTGVRTEEARELAWEHVHIDPPEPEETEAEEAGEDQEAEGEAKAPAEETKAGEFVPHVEVWRSVRRNKDTKTEKSRRTLRLPAKVVTALRWWRDEQIAERRRNGHAWEDIRYVFGTRNDTPMSHGNVRRRFKDVLADAGLPPDWTPRELRHSFVSVMSASGAREELIADLVGHKLTSTTRRVYRHQLKPIIMEGAELMDGVFGGTPDPRG